MRIYRLRVVAAALCVASLGSVALVETGVSAATRQTTTKPKKKTTTRKKTTITRKPVTTKASSTVSSSTLVAGATELDVRNAAIKDLYERYKTLVIKINENQTNVLVVPTDGRKILTGQALQNLSNYEKEVQESGLYYVNVKHESFDFRIESSSATAARIRVCVRLSDSGAFRRKDNSSAPNPVPVAVNDQQYDLVYSADVKRWFVSDNGYFNEEADKSKCADGK
jgi:hypothetical protein